jgi:hypothetical protein
MEKARGSIPLSPTAALKLKYAQRRQEMKNTHPIFLFLKNFMENGKVNRYFILPDQTAKITVMSFLEHEDPPWICVTIETCAERIDKLEETFYFRYPKDEKWNVEKKGGNIRFVSPFYSGGKCETFWDRDSKPWLADDLSGPETEQLNILVEIMKEMKEYDPEDIRKEYLKERFVLKPLKAESFY